MALRWTRLLLLGDIALLAIIIAALLGAQLASKDIQQLKWATMFVGGILLLLAGLLSIVTLTLQIIVGLRRPEVK
jgi:hypothetical protein